MRRSQFLFQLFERPVSGSPLNNGFTAALALYNQRLITNSTRWYQNNSILALQSAFITCYWAYLFSSLAHFVERRYTVIHILGNRMWFISDKRPIEHTHTHTHRDNKICAVISHILWHYVTACSHGMLYDEGSIFITEFSWFSIYLSFGSNHFSVSRVIEFTRFPWPPVTLTFDSWPWKPIQQCPLTWWILMQSFIGMPPQSTDRVAWNWC